MPYEVRRLVLELLHGWVGLGYIALSITIAFLLVQIVELLGVLTRNEPTFGGDAGHPHRRQMDPTVLKLANRSQAVNRSVFMMLAGLSLFFFGCGVHHLHMAIETVQDAYEQGALAIDVFVGDSSYVHHFLIQAMQAVGWPLLVFGGLWLRRLLRPER